MGKIINYLGFITVLIILFDFAGIRVASPSGWLIGFITNPSSWSTSSFFAQAGAVIGIASATIFIATAIIFTDPTRLRAPFAIFLLSVGWDITGIYGVLAIVNSSFALIVTAPLVIAYIIGIVEWWSGSST